MGTTTRGLFLVTFGQNKKGGRDKKESKEYVMNSIVPLYPNAKDKQGKWVVLKVDSGLGYGNMNLLARLMLLGFVMYLGVPNTTHLMQDKMERNYGPFKQRFVTNLDIIVFERICAERSLSLQLKLVGLPEFVGEDHEIGCIILDGAFQAGFSCHR